MNKIDDSRRKIEWYQNLGWEVWVLPNEIQVIAPESNRKYNWETIENFDFRDYIGNLARLDELVNATDLCFAIDSFIAYNGNIREISTKNRKLE